MLIKLFERFFCRLLVNLCVNFNFVVEVLRKNVKFIVLVFLRFTFALKWLLSGEMSAVIEAN